MALIHPPLLELKNQALLTSVTTQLVPGWIDLYKQAEARGPFKKGEKCKKGIVFRATPLDGILIDGVQRDSYTRRQSWANPYVGPRTLTLYLARQRRWNRYGTLIFRCISPDTSRPPLSIATGIMGRGTRWAWSEPPSRRGR